MVCERVNTILPILVLYNCNLKDSTTYKSFLTASNDASLNPALIAVYDNSALRHVSSAEAQQLLAYRHDPANGGISAAYNWALEIAISQGYSWLLLLDQDSQLPSTFLTSLIRDVDMYAANQEIVAIVPLVNGKGVAISPKRVRFGRLTPLPAPSPTVLDYELTAINSGASVKASFMTSVGGFNPAFRLDCLDHWVFRRIYANGKKAAISGSVLEHNLSVADYRNQVSDARYRNILSAEAHFVMTQKLRLEFPVYVIRLLFRAIKQALIYRRPNIAVLTCKMAIRITARVVGIRA